LQVTLKLNNNRSKGASVKTRSRAKKTVLQKIADLESHLFLLRKHLTGLGEDSSHLKAIAAELRLLICRSGRRQTDGLLFRIANDLQVSDSVFLQVAGRVNPDHPLARSMQFAFVPIRRAGQGDPRISAEHHSLREVVETYEAAFLRGKSLTFNYLIRAVAEQMGSAHEDEDLDFEILDLSQISLDGTNPYQMALSTVADLVLEVGERVMQKAEAELGYKRVPHSSDDGDFTLVVRMGLRVTLAGRIPVVAFRSHTCDVDVHCEAGPMSVVFKTVRHGRTVCEVAARYPTGWPLGTDAVFALAYSSRARQVHAITNGDEQDVGISCDLGWVAGDLLLTTVPPLSDGSVYLFTVLATNRVRFCPGDAAKA
jgi:hypothetical protein